MALDCLGGENELVAGDDGLAELDAIHTEKDGEFAGVLKALGEEQAGELCHCLDNQDARHNGRAGEVALEEVLVEGYVFYALYEAVAFKLDYLVNQQKWISMG